MAASPPLSDLIVPAPHVPMPVGGAVHRILPSTLNLLTARANREKIEASAEAIRGFTDGLDKLATTLPRGADKIPSLLHFVYGLKKPEPFPLYARIAVLSAMLHNPGWRVVFHLRHEPIGPHWDALKPKILINPVPEFSHFGIAPLRHYAHKADVIRLLVLKHMGGAYLDIDTLTQKSFAPLVDRSMVMGIQAALPGQPGGLCNAIMLSESHAPFLDLWLKRYRHFRSRGADWLWDFHSVKTPAKLAAVHPDAVTVLKPEAFFDPLWDRIEQVMFGEDAEDRPNFAFHLWNNMIIQRLESIDETYIRTSSSLYAKLARPVLKGK